MHPALLLDDVLRQILDLCPDSTLPAVARTCRAWKDPALDSVWCHINSLGPLLSLIPGLFCFGGIYNCSFQRPLDLGVFHSYACRIKHITQRSSARVHPALLSALLEGAPILKRLATTRLSSVDPLCVSASLSLAPTLRQLDLDLGFKKRPSSDDPSDYLERLLLIAPGIERIRLRGSASQQLISVISRMQNLRGLSLRTGTFITEDALVAISTLPHLYELEVEAGSLDVNNIARTWTSSADCGYFQSLQKLHICAQAPLIELLLKTFHPDREPLRTLRIEVTTPSESTVSWKTILDLITTKTSHSLEHLTIEQHLHDDIENIDTAINGPTILADLHNTRPRTETNRITFDIIRLLAPLRQLRTLRVDMTRMPDLHDQDLEALAKWWPALEHLDLGTIHSSECTPSSAMPRATLACLRALATSLPKLETLILPLNITGVDDGVLPSVAPSALRRATFSSPTPPSEPAVMARYLQSLFPRLTKVDGTDRHDEEWGKVQALL